tara:strand:- start:4205 stop:4459 length:255 start_codon:yes stop_codon:yes gene_type:complete
MTLHLPPEEIIARNKAKQKQWRIDHPDRIKAFHAKYNAKPEVMERKAAWAREHKDDINARRREIYRLKRDMANQVEEAPAESVE